MLMFMNGGLKMLLEAVGKNTTCEVSNCRVLMDVEQ